MAITIKYNIMCINYRNEEKCYKDFDYKDFDKAVTEFHDFQSRNKDLKSWLEKKTYYPTGKITTETLSEENIQHITQTETSIRTVLGIILMAVSIGAVFAFGFLGVIGIAIAAILIS
jgi:hypothetical protein